MVFYGEVWSLVEDDLRSISWLRARRKEPNFSVLQGSRGVAVLAARIGLSQSTISRIWRAFGLKPHRAEGFQLSSDPLLIDKVRDIIGLYLDPPHHPLVLCVDEKSQIQALSRTQPVLPMRARQLERRTQDYQRHGVTSHLRPWISPLATSSASAIAVIVPSNSSTS